MTADRLAELGAEFIGLECKCCDGSLPIRMLDRVLQVLCIATLVIIFDLLPLGANPVAAQTSAAPLSAGPHFRDDGPNADEFGRNEGYPSCKGLAYIQETRCRVGALSHYDALFPAPTTAAPNQPANPDRSPTELGT